MACIISRLDDPPMQREDVLVWMNELLFGEPMVEGVGQEKCGRRWQQEQVWVLYNDVLDLKYDQMPDDLVSVLTDVMYYRGSFLQWYMERVTLPAAERQIEETLLAYVLGGEGKKTSPQVLVRVKALNDLDYDRLARVVLREPDNLTDRIHKEKCDVPFLVYTRNTYGDVAAVCATCFCCWDRKESVYSGHTVNTPITPLEFLEALENGRFFPW